jgi:O-antigen/teichoic acid export membrane protein
MIKKLFSNSAFTIFNNLSQLVISLGSGMIIARNLGTAGKGEVFLITQIFTLCTIIFSFGFGPAIIYFLKNNKISNSAVNYFILAYSIFLAFIFILSVFFFGSDIIHFFSHDFEIDILTYIFLISHLNVVSGLIGYKKLKNENGLKRLSIITITSGFLYLIFLSYFVLIEDLDVLGVIYALMVGVFFKCIMLTYDHNHHSLQEFSKIKTGEIIKITKFGFHTFLSNIFLTGVFRLDTFFLNKMVNFAEIGLYSVAVNVGELMLLIPSAIGVALFPHLLGISKEDQINSMCLVGRISFLIGVFGVFILAIIGYPFIHIFFGKNFLPAYPPFVILLPGLLAMTLNYAYSNYFHSIGKPLIGAFIFLVGLIVNILLNLWLIPIYGIFGAAISSSLAYFVITGGFIYKIKKINRLSLREFVFPKISDYAYIKHQLFLFINKK